MCAHACMHTQHVATLKHWMTWFHNCLLNSLIRYSIFYWHHLRELYWMHTSQNLPRYCYFLNFYCSFTSLCHFFVGNISVTCIFNLFRCSLWCSMHVHWILKDVAWNLPCFLRRCLVLMLIPLLIGNFGYIIECLEITLPGPQDKLMNYRSRMELYVFCYIQFILLP